MLKERTPPDIYRKKFAEKITTGQFNCILYTDASTAEETTSYCVYRYDNKCDKILSQKLTTPNQSPFVGEVMALVEAFQIANRRHDTTAICSDSLSAIRKILNNKNKTPIFHLLRSIIRSNFPRIHLIWSPGHTGIPGNEKADFAARETIKMPLEYIIPPFASSMFKIVSDNIRREAEIRWNNSHSFLRQHKTTL
ncbi:uncharacterized protein LOC129950542 [Eupeodes corollae]|uniref:uncharacterized protein LOC129950542 n=1 Tax=Eupeodes corollae TaxID=290404 RepID=UPI002493B5C9|nr:uncharacterized protein LOC129950542 [Eupeodes corollae]